jgi:Cu/Ag efflux protein CusF
MTLLQWRRHFSSSQSIALTLALVVAAAAMGSSTAAAFALPQAAQHHHLMEKALSLSVPPPTQPSLFDTATKRIPSLFTAYDDSVPVYQAEDAFTDQVSLSDITSDPILQASFAAAGIAIIILFILKAVVTKMDDAVEKVAIDFDRVMRLKYSKKWERFMVEEKGEGDAADDGKEGDRIQLIVEEMERLRKEDPEFMDRVMLDIERMQK